MQINERVPPSTMVEQDRVLDGVVVVQVRINRRRVEEHPVGIARQVCSKSKEIVRVLHGGRKPNNTDATRGCTSAARKCVILILLVPDNALPPCFRTEAVERLVVKINFERTIERYAAGLESEEAVGFDGVSMYVEAKLTFAIETG